MADRDPVRRQEFARAGGFGKARAEAQREARAAELAEHIQRTVNQAPPLSELQRARLAALLLSGRRPDDRGAIPA